MAQIIPIVSEALQATIRRLLPSQNGFGEDLQAQNVIVPIIDLTPTAEGSALDDDLQRAFSFDDVTSYIVSGNTATLANTPGFYRIYGAVNVRGSASVTNTLTYSLSNGLSSKTLFISATTGGGTDVITSHTVDFVVFLNAGDSVTCTGSNASAKANGAVIQIADVNGVLSNPAGFNPQ
jgi:hypothetical protein